MKVHKHILQFKQKHLTLAETAKKYTLCEQLTMEMKELREKQCELELEICEEGKESEERHATEIDDESSDVDGDCRSSGSRSVTP